MSFVAADLSSLVCFGTIILMEFGRPLNLIYQQTTHMFLPKSQVTKKLRALYYHVVPQMNIPKFAVYSCGRAPHHQQQWRIKLKSQIPLSLKITRSDSDWNPGKWSITQKQNMTQNHCEPLKKERTYQLLPNSSGAKNWHQVFGFLRIDKVHDQESNGFIHGSDARCHHLQPLAQRPKCRWLFGGRFYMYIFRKIASNIGLYKCPGSCVGMTWLIVIIVFVAYTAWFTTITFILHLKNYSQSGSPLESLIMNDQLPCLQKFSLRGCSYSLGHVWCGCPQVDSLTLRI